VSIDNFFEFFFIIPNKMTLLTGLQEKQPTVPEGQEGKPSSTIRKIS
jgi:hypothetical protein